MRSAAVKAGGLWPWAATWRGRCRVVLEHAPWEGVLSMTLWDSDTRTRKCYRIADCGSY